MFNMKLCKAQYKSRIIIQTEFLPYSSDRTFTSVALKDPIKPNKLFKARLSPELQSNNDSSVNGIWNFVVVFVSLCSYFLINVGLLVSGKNVWRTASRA